MPHKKTLQETLEALRDEYARALPGKIKNLQEDWKILKHAWSDGKLGSFQRDVHKITGDAGAFGFSEVTEYARPLDMTLIALIQSGHPPSGEELRKIEDGLEWIDVAAQNSDEQKAYNDAMEEQAAKKNKLIYLVEDDEDFSKYLAIQLRHLGYSVRVFNTIKNLVKSTKEEPPAALIMDIMLAEGELAGPQVMLKIQKDRDEPLPVIFMSARVDMKARLAAVRANGDAYFTKPFDFDALAAKLEELTSRESTLTYRAMVVDDTGKYGEKYVKMLRKEKIQAKFLSNPMRILEAMEKFSPEIILINTQLSTLSGLELAMVVRQQEKYASLPIIFFAQQFDRTLRRSAMHGMADDYLNENIEPEQLVATVINRIRQTRHHRERIQELRNRDPISGLYNRNYLLSQLDLVDKGDYDAAYPLAVLYISVDNYSGIEKIMGLPVSQSLIKDTAKFLESCSTEKDLLARLNEHSFVIISFDRLLENVRGLAESIRSTLENHSVEMEGQEISSTCSIGIGLRHHSSENPQQALQDADSACATARKQGGNQIVLHDSARAAKLETERLEYWHEAIRLALDNDTFILNYQPIAGLHGKENVLYDVLVSMRIREETVAAAKFIPIAEEFGLIHELDRRVVNYAVEKLAESSSASEISRFFVRLSGASLDDTSLQRWIERCLEQNGMSPQVLIFDISQYIVSSDYKKVENFLKWAKSIGCGVALRDMDADEGSFQLLKMLDVDFVKVAASTVQGLSENQEKQETLSHIIKAIHERGKPVIVPFVEDAATLSLLWQFGVEYIMGHFIQPPGEELDYFR